MLSRKKFCPGQNPDWTGADTWLRFTVRPLKQQFRRKLYSSETTSWKRRGKVSSIRSPNRTPSASAF
jgi:hypothetical protein